MQSSKSHLIYRAAWMSRRRQSIRLIRGDGSAITGGTATLSGYRAYIIGIDGHRFVRVAQFSTDHPDDATAMKAAEELVDRHDIELWHNSRLVARFTPAQLDRVGKALIDALQTLGNECVIHEVKVERKDSD